MSKAQVGDLGLVCCLRLFSVVRHICASCLRFHRREPCPYELVEVGCHLSLPVGLGALTDQRGRFGQLPRAGHRVLQRGSGMIRERVSVLRAVVEAEVLGQAGLGSRLAPPSPEGEAPERLSGQITGVHKNTSRGVNAMLFRWKPSGSAGRTSDHSTAVEWLTPEQPTERISDVYASLPHQSGSLRCRAFPDSPPGPRTCLRPALAPTAPVVRLKRAR
ncbi:hypothetical protein ACF06N_14555 [Streptomyces albidoflavus]